MKALVIGGAGFIGSTLCEALLDVGDEVFCVDNYSLGKPQNVSHIIDREGFNIIHCDVLNKNEFDQVFKNIKPDYVYHLAANSDIQASADNPEIEFMNTYSTTYRVLSAMRENGTKKLFFASTSAVYGDKRDVMLDENTANLEPVSYYGAAKLGSEALISAFSYMNDFNALVFRFPNVTGPRLTHGVIYDFINKLRNKRDVLEILGNGKQTKPYIYVDDLASAIIQLRDVSRGVELYNIGVEGTTSVKEIADIICEEMQLNNVVYKYTGGEGGWKGDVPKFEYCINKVHKAGWYARYTSSEAVRKSVQDMLAKEC